MMNSNMREIYICHTWQSHRYIASFTRWLQLKYVPVTSDEHCAEGFTWSRLDAIIGIAEASFRIATARIEIILIVLRRWRWPIEIWRCLCSNWISCCWNSRTCPNAANLDDRHDWRSFSDLLVHSAFIPCLAPPEKFIFTKSEFKEKREENQWKESDN